MAKMHFMQIYLMTYFTVFTQILGIVFPSVLEKWPSELSKRWKLWSIGRLNEIFGLLLLPKLLKNTIHCKKNTLFASLRAKITGFICTYKGNKKKTRNNYLISIINLDFNFFIKLCRILFFSLLRQKYRFDR